MVVVRLASTLSKKGKSAAVVALRSRPEGVGIVSGGRSDQKLEYGLAGAPLAEVKSCACADGIFTSPSPLPTAL